MYTSLTEEWKEIKGYPDYEVSNLGRVRSKDRYRKYRFGQRLVRGQLIKPYVREKRGGYVDVVLSHNSKHKNFALHRLVAEAFVPNPEDKPVVNHIDFNTRNNAADNLEWVTVSENVQWSAVHGRMSGKCNKPLIATNVKTGEEILFESSLEAEEKGGFDRAAIWRQMAGEYSHHHGYTWRFAKVD